MCTVRPSPGCGRTPSGAAPRDRRHANVRRATPARRSRAVPEHCGGPALHAIAFRHDDDGIPSLMAWQRIGHVIEGGDALAPDCHNHITGLETALLRGAPPPHPADPHTLANAAP